MESYLLYYISRLALSSVALLPRTAAARMLEALASMAFRLDSLHRHIAMVNLTIAFPELTSGEQSLIARRSFQSTAQNLLEVSRMPHLTRENIGSLVRYDPEFGLNQYERARSQGRGVLFLTGHFGAWELLPTAHALHGYPLSFVTRPLDNAPLERYLCKIRQIAGNQVIHKRNSVRPILTKLKSGGDVGILMDQNTFLSEGIFADFFGLPAATSSSVALLALRTQSPVIPGYLKPARDGRYTIRFLPAVELVRTGDAAHDTHTNTTIFNRILEDIVREQPESWLWGHMRWKYRPPGEPDLYALPSSDLREYLRRYTAQQR